MGALLEALTGSRSLVGEFERSFDESLSYADLHAVSSWRLSPGRDSHVPGRPMAKEMKCRLEFRKLPMKEIEFRLDRCPA